MNIILFQALCVGCASLLELDKTSKFGKNEWTLVCQNQNCEYCGRHLKLPLYPVEWL